MEDYEKIEVECDKERVKNEKLLKEFSNWLKKSNLTKKQYGWKIWKNLKV